MAGKDEMRPVGVHPLIDLMACRLHADQSYYGKPIDPEVVARVRDSLDKYPGPKSAEEKDRIIAAKAAQGRKTQVEISAEYWTWARRVKEESAPVFKLPDNPKKGMPTQEEYIKEKVEQGLQEMRKNTKEHMEWVAALEERRQEEKSEALKAKMAGDAAFTNSAEERHQEIQRRELEMQRRKKQEEAEYWRWLNGMKNEVKKRPSSAPAGRSSGAESASSMAQKKMQETKRIWQEIGSEYRSWVGNVSVPKFHLPTARVDNEERTRDLLRQRKRREQKESAAYYEEVNQMKQKHHARIMGMAQERLAAGRRYDEAHEGASRSLAEAMEKQKQKVRAVSAKSRQEVKDMQKRVKDKPLFLEMAYKK